jgi:hypothetical protein
LIGGGIGEVDDALDVLMMVVQIHALRG